MKKFLLLLLFIFVNNTIFAQNIVTYAGNSGKETFYDVMQITDGTFLVVGYADNLTWTGSAPKTQLSYTGTIPNASGSNRYGFILRLSTDLQTILQVVHFPQGAVEDIRFIKTNTQTYSATGDLFISCNTSDSSANNGGYLLAKLNNNFINGIPTSLTWNYNVNALSGPKDYHPWDVTNDGNIYFVMGQSHSSSWSAIFCLDANGQRKVVENWRTHWKIDGSEWKGAPASSYVGTGPTAISYSGIALKGQGRCEFRSWSANDYNEVSSDGNGRTKKGKWPCDIFFNGPCDNANPTSVGPGYTGYSQSSPVWGASSLVVDRRNNNLYIGMNMKSTLPAGQPDFEPAVISMNNTGSLLWWSRLYHEVSATGAVVNSTPDQYVDALAIDYSNNKLVVGARCHGNNTENFWRGNSVAANPSAVGFQNQFSGTNGNIHLSWLGKLGLSDGVLSNSTYMGELFEGTTGIGAALTDPNMDGWPNPNGGWPNLNTTRMGKNALKVSSNGDVCVVAVGRRTMTTANAYQKNINPIGGTGIGSWNNFVRVYDSNFIQPKYSSLVTGAWNPVDGVGGGNTELFGVYKTNLGVVCVGKQTANATTLIADGNNIPTTNVTPWGSATPSNESAILVYYKSANISNPSDSLASNEFQISDSNYQIYPNPTKSILNISFSDFVNNDEIKYEIFDLFGRNVQNGIIENNQVNVNSMSNGIYIFKIEVNGISVSKKFALEN